MPGQRIIVKCLLLGTAVLPSRSADDILDKPLEALMQLDIPMVQSASRFSQKASDAPATVSIITERDIRQHGWRTLGEILQSLNGTYLVDDRSYPVIGVRGMQRPGDFNNRISLLVNGHRYNEAIYNSAPIGTDFFLDTDLIESIEFIRGPGSAIYGNNALYGVVNIIPKRGRDIAGVEVSTRGGSHGTYGGRVTAGNRWSNGAEALFSASFAESDGNSALRFPEFGGVARGLDYWRTHSFYGSFGIGGFTLEAGHHSREKAYPTASYETVFGDHRAQLLDQYTFAAMKYEVKLPWEIQLTARALYQDFSYDAVFPYDRFTGVNLDSARGRFAAVEAVLSRKFLDKHQLSAGFEVRHAFQQDQHSYYIRPDASLVDERHASADSAVFVQGDFELHKKVRLSVAARFDNSANDDALISPRFGLVWSPQDDTTVKAIYGRAFRAANAYERWYFNEHQEHMHNEHAGVPEPESTDFIEVAMEQRLGKNWRARISAYTGEARDLIVPEVDGADITVFENAQTIQSHGVEAEVEGRFSNGIKARLAYAWQHSESRLHDGHEHDHALSNSPTHIAKLHLAVPIVGEKLSLGVEVIGVSSVHTLGDAKERAYWLANLNLLSTDAIPGLEVSAGVFNVFDHRYAVPSGGDNSLDRIAQDRRTFGLKATYKF